MPESTVDVTRPSPAAPSRLADWIARMRAGDDPAAAVALLLVVAVAAGFFWYRAGVGAGGAELAGAARPVAAEGARPGLGSAETSSTTGAVVVHVAGAVRKAGLYTLAAGSRVADAIAAAGGGADGADFDRVNLAARVVDGQRVAVPRAGEPLPAALDSGAAGAGVAEAGVPTGPVDVNSAGQAELETLPGVGPATARAILAERERRGGFRSVRDLLRVPGIGQRRFAELRDRVRV